jgi:hypothetical protein
MVVVEKRTDVLDESRCRELVERILATSSFQRSARLRDLLVYLSNHAFSGDTKDLTENRIGRAVFGKPSDYSPVEDSSVRVHARQLRLKLHEYFAEEGRNEPIVIEIPKGNYNVVFRTANLQTQSPGEAHESGAGNVVDGQSSMWAGAFFRKAFQIIPWVLVCALTVVLIYQQQTRSVRGVRGANPVNWPLSRVFDGDHRTYIVLADADYGTLRILSKRQGSLSDYLDSRYPQQFVPNEDKEQLAPLLAYLSGSVLTSYADAVTAVKLIEATQGSNGQTSLRSSRDLRLRDFDQGNFVLLGSPSSNPWVSLYEPKLNFVEGEGEIGGSGPKYFKNRAPLPGEQKQYFESGGTGKTGVDYTSIALLPLTSGAGSVLILQGLSQEGTEAAGEFVEKPENTARLINALGGKDSTIVYFEALLRTNTLEGTSYSTEIVSVRRIH